MAVHLTLPVEFLKLAYCPGVIINSDFYFQRCSGLDVNYIAPLLWKMCIIDYKNDMLVID